MPHFALVTTLEPLGSRGGNTDVSYFGLTLSAGIGDAGAAVPSVAARELLKSWRWTLQSVNLLHQDQAGQWQRLTGVTVELVDVQTPGVDPDYAELVRRMEGRWTTPDAQANERFRFRQPADEISLGEDYNEPAANLDLRAKRSWPAELANASAFPYPYAQWLNLAVHFRVAWNGTARPAQLVCAPTFAASAGAGSYVYTPLFPPTPDAAVPVPPGGVLWSYAAAAGSPLADAKAYCGTSASDPPAVPMGGVYLDSLWVLPSGSGVFGRDWRAELLPGAVEAFDLPQRLLDALRTRVQQAGEALALARGLWKPVLAGLRDQAGWGNESTPGFGPSLPGPSLLQEWAVELTPDQAEARAAVTAIANRLAQPNVPAVTLTQWVGVLRAALEEKKGAGAAELLAEEPPADDTAAQLVQRLEQVVNALRDPAFLAEVLVRQWKLLPDVALTEGQQSALRVFAASPRTVSRLRASAAAPCWAAWIRALTLNAAPAAQRNALRERLVGVLQEALQSRFAETGPNQVPELRVRQPRQPLSAQQLDELRPLLEGWARAEAMRLVPEPEVERTDAVVKPTLPTAVQVSQRRQWQRATPVPHPLAFEIGVIQPDAPQPTRDDVLRAISGVGVMLRECGSPRWRSLNLASATDLVSQRNGDQYVGRINRDDWGKRPLLVVSRPSLQQGLSDATVSYDNEPITALGPSGIATNHALMTDQTGTVEQPAFRTRYADPGLFSPHGLDKAWAEMVGLDFGCVYEGLVYARTNSGAIPVALAAAPDSPAKLRAVPPTTDITSSEFLRRVWYPRRVAVGQPRLSMAGRREFRTPAIPDEVSLRARELFGREVIEAGSEGAFLLLCPCGTPVTHPTEFKFEVRPPATDFQTWLRWQKHSPARQDVWREYHQRLRDNHAGNPPQPVALDDPAVDRLGALLLEYRPQESDWVSRGTVEWDHVQGDGEGLSVAHAEARTNALRKQIEVRAVQHGTASLSRNLIAQVVQGRIYRLLVVSLTRRDPSAVRFDTDYQVGWNADRLVETEFPTWQVFSPWTLWVEVATPRWVVPAEAQTTPQQAAREDAEALMRLFGLLTPGFSYPTPRRDDGTYPDGGRLEVSARVSHREQPFANAARLERQRWVWQGRPVFVGAEESAIPVPPRWFEWFDPNLVEAWEVRQFGDRDDADVVHHPMEGELDTVANAPPLSRRSEHRTWRYTLDFGADRGASYHRFALRVFHRYGSLFGMEAGVVATSAAQRWHSIMIPCRPEKAPERPSVRLILPLTETILGPINRARTPGLIVQLRGGAFEQGGLAERIVVEAVEIAPDPLESAAAASKELGQVRDLKVQGPIGHSFDADDGARRMVTATYIIDPPTADDLDGYFFRLRFGRALDARLQVGAAAPLPALAGKPDAWSEGHWAQMLPDVRLTPTGVPVDNFRLLTGAGGTLRTVNPNGTNTDPIVATGARIYEPFLAITEWVVDAADRPSEAYVGVYRRTGVGTWQWLPSGRPGAVAPVFAANPRLRARILQVQLGSQEAWQTALPGSLTEPVFWDRIFGAADGTPLPIKDRMRIVAIYPPINTPPPPGGR